MRLLEAEFGALVRVPCAAVLEGLSLNWGAARSRAVPFLPSPTEPVGKG